MKKLFTFTVALVVTTLMSYASIFGGTLYWGVNRANCPEYDEYTVVLVQGGNQPRILRRGMDGTLSLKGGGTIIGVAFLGKNAKDFIDTNEGVPSIGIDVVEWDGMVNIYNPSSASIAYEPDPSSQTAQGLYYMVILNGAVQTMADGSIPVASHYAVMEWDGDLAPEGDVFNFNQSINFTIPTNIAWREIPEFEIVPEPATLALLALGAALLGLRRSRK